MNKNILGILLLFVLGGCTKNYKVSPLKPLKKEQAHFVDKKDDVEIRVKKLDRKDLGKFFNSYFSKQDIAGYFLTIKNKSDQTVYFDAQDIDLPLVSTQELYQNLSRSSLKRLGLGIGAAVALGSTFALLATIPFCCMAPCLLADCGLLATILSGFGAPIVFMGSVFSGVNSAVFNEKLKKDLKYKVASSITIKPSKKHTLIFVTRENKKSFDMTLQKGKEKPQHIVFNVKVKRGQK
jgi:hypothetical protein